MVDVNTWHTDWENDFNALMNKLLAKIERNEHFSLLEMVPEHEKHLSHKPYSYWDPPGSRETALMFPNANLASILTTNAFADTVLVALDCIGDLGTFKNYYGLSEKCGLTYEQFLELIQRGYIRLNLSTAPKFYQPDFYQEIFAACRNCDDGGYLPPFPGHMFRNLYEMWPIYQQINAKDSTGKPKKILNFPLMNLNTWMKKVNAAIQANPGGFHEWDNYQVTSTGLHADASEFAKRLHSLELFGYENLANISFQIFEQNPSLGFDTSMIYLNYLSWGFSKAVGGVRTYGKPDLWNLAFWRFIDDTTILNNPFETPAGHYVTLDPVEFQMISRADTGELSSAITKGSDEELKKIKFTAQRAFQNYEFSQYFHDCKKMDEIIIERLNSETKDLYRQSTMLKGFIYHGGQIGASLGLTSVPPEYKLLLKMLLATNPVKTAMETGSEQLSRFIMKKWFFKEKGLPCVLWDYHIAGNPEI